MRQLCIVRVFSLTRQIGPQGRYVFGLTSLEIEPAIIEPTTVLSVHRYVMQLLQQQECLAY
jgi:hypothetical protein